MSLTHFYPSINDIIRDYNFTRRADLDHLLRFN